MRPVVFWRNRHIKNLGDVPKANGADAVGSLLVFLDLLECQPEGVRDQESVAGIVGKRPAIARKGRGAHASRFHVPKAISQTSPSGRQSKRALPFN
jgi:hypothetical protein